MPILETEQFRAVLAPSARLLPQFSRLDGRHAQFQGPRPVHFLADDALDLVQGAQTHRKPGVQASRQAANHAGPQHQLMADDLGVGGNFLERRNRMLG